MDCNALTVLGLMTGAAALSAAAAFFYQKNISDECRAKAKSFNAALVNLQEERAGLIVKNQTMFTDNISLQNQVSNLQGQQNTLKNQLENHINNPLHAKIADLEAEREVLKSQLESHSNNPLQLQITNLLDEQKLLKSQIERHEQNPLFLEVTHLLEEQNLLRGQIQNLENHNSSLITENQNLEKVLFATKSNKSENLGFSFNE